MSLSIPVDVAKAHGRGGLLTVDVLLEPAGTFDLASGSFLGDGSDPPSGAFHIHGTLYPAGTLAAACDPDLPSVAPIGEFACWGFRPGPPVSPPGFVSQEFHLFGQGKIQVQGREGPTSIIAVVGGTGDFVNVRGEGTRRDQFVCTADPLTIGYTIDFDLKGAKKGKD